MLFIGKLQVTIKSTDVVGNTNQKPSIFRLLIESKFKLDYNNQSLISSIPTLGGQEVAQ